MSASTPDTLKSDSLYRAKSQPDIFYLTNKTNISSSESFKQSNSVSYLGRTIFIIKTTFCALIDIITNLFNQIISTLSSFLDFEIDNQINRITFLKNPTNLIKTSNPSISSINLEDEYLLTSNQLMILSLLRKFANDELTNHLFNTNPIPHSNSGSIEQQTELLKGHFFAIINFLRGDTSQTIETSDLIKLEKGIECIANFRHQDIRSLFHSEENLNFFILHIFKAPVLEFHERFKSSCEEKLSSIKFLTFNSQNEFDLLKGKKEIIFSPLWEGHAYLDLIQFLSLSDVGISIIKNQYQPVELNQSDTIYTALSKVKQNTALPLLQNHLKALVEIITVEDSPQLTEEHFQSISDLIEMAGVSNASISSFKTLSIKLANLLGSNENQVKAFFVGQELKSIKKSSSILSITDPLPPFQRNKTMSRLSNIGMTCYMNSMLWMIAQSNEFDFLFSEELPNYPYRELASAARSLKNQLKGIISYMRQGKIVEREHLKTFYELLRLNGWTHKIGSMQDPQELFALVSDKLSPLNQKKGFTFLQADPNPESQRNQPPFYEPQITEALQLSMPPRAHIKDLNSLQELVEFNLFSQEEASTDAVKMPTEAIQPTMPLRTIIKKRNIAQNIIDFYSFIQGKVSEYLFEKPKTPVIDEKNCDINLSQSSDHHSNSPSLSSVLQASSEHSVKISNTTYLLGSPPPFLMVHLKIFDSPDMYGKINEPRAIIASHDNVTSTCKLPFTHSKEDLNSITHQVYKLKGAICHQGPSLVSGHYTFYSLQLSEDSSKELWIKYDDQNSSTTTTYDPQNTEEFAIVKKDINSNAYYLVFEAVSEV